MFKNVKNKYFIHTCPKWTEFNWLQSYHGALSTVFYLFDGLMVFCTYFKESLTSKSIYFNGISKILFPSYWILLYKVGCQIPIWIASNLKSRLLKWTPNLHTFYFLFLSYWTLNTIKLVDFFHILWECITWSAWNFTELLVKSRSSVYYLILVNIIFYSGIMAVVQVASRCIIHPWFNLIQLCFINCIIKILTKTKVLMYGKLIPVMTLQLYHRSCIFFQVLNLLTTITEFLHNTCTKIRTCINTKLSYFPFL